MIQFEIITPEKVVYRDAVESITLPTSEGEITVLPGHLPLIALLQAGALTVRKGKEESYMAVSSGFVEVQSGSRVKILADTADRAEDLTLPAIEAARERARTVLREKRRSDDVGYHAAAAILERELARARVARKHHAKRGISISVEE